MQTRSVPTGVQLVPPSEAAVMEPCDRCGRRAECNCYPLVLEGHRAECACYGCEGGPVYEDEEL